MANQIKTFLFSLQVLTNLFIIFSICIYTACSNSNSEDFNGSISFADWDTSDTTVSSPSEIIHNLPLDDMEYPYAGIPRIVIETEHNQAINNCETEIPARLQIWGEYGPESDILKLTIRGRGNSSWTGVPKKSYKIEFIDKQSLFGMPKDRDWALIANHYDATLIRNHIANYMSRISSTPYTPKNLFVELFLNAEYKGTYQLFETLKISRKRINIGKDNFLLEVDNHPKSKDISFNVNHLSNTVKIHSSSISKKDSNYNYIQKAINDIDSVLFSSVFLDNEKGYKKYIDIDALVEWYVITEITKNASSHANWYMTYERNGKLKMGPFWDYDLAFGNTLWGIDANKISGFWMDTIPWFAQFIQDSIFRKKAAQRFDYFFEHKDFILVEISKTSQMLKQTIINNERLWNVLNCQSCSSSDIQKEYDKHVSNMEKWFIRRLDWLKQQNYCK